MNFEPIYERAAITLRHWYFAVDGTVHVAKHQMKQMPPLCSRTG